MNVSDNNSGSTEDLNEKIDEEYMSEVTWLTKESRSGRESFLDSAGGTRTHSAGYVDV